MIEAVLGSARAAVSTGVAFCLFAGGAAANGRLDVRVVDDATGKTIAARLSTLR